MANEKIYSMPFSKIYPALVSKAVKKKRTEDEVEQVIEWLTGYTPAQLADLTKSDITYGDFFRQAPLMNPDRKLIKGTVCHVRIENIEDPLLQDIRYLDKLIDELAKGKPLHKIVPQK